MTRNDAPALVAASVLVVVGAFLPGDDWTGADNSCDEFRAAAATHACPGDEQTSSDDLGLDLDIPLNLELRLG